MSTDPLHVLIAGAGVAGLETLIALRSLAGDRVRLTLVDPSEDFVYAPLSVGAPFAHRGAERRPLRKIAGEFGAEFVQDSLARVHPGEHRIETGEGADIAYGVLVTTIGARRRPAFPKATTFRGQEDAESVRGLVRDVEEGYARRVAFVVPGGVTWSLPLYELALMTALRAREMSEEIELTFITPEDAPLVVFGQEASAGVSSLLDAAGIAFEGSTYADVESAQRVWLRPSGRALEVDRVLALPVLEGPAPPGLPADERGFIPTGPDGRVPGADDVYAAGDGTQFPVKQGGIATQQADLVAADIAQRVGVSVEPVEHFRPVLRAKLMTGARERFLRSDETTGGRGASSQSADHALWWPPSKVAGAYLAPYLAGPDAVPPPDREGLEIELPLEAGPSGDR